jgi:hypothetical protein
MSDKPPTPAYCAFAGFFGFLMFVAICSAWLIDSHRQGVLEKRIEALEKATPAPEEQGK